MFNKFRIIYCRLNTTDSSYIWGLQKWQSRSFLYTIQNWVICFNCIFLETLVLFLFSFNWYIFFLICNQILYYYCFGNHQLVRYGNQKNYLKLYLLTQSVLLCHWTFGQAFPWWPCSLLPMYVSVIYNYSGSKTISLSNLQTILICILYLIDFLWFGEVETLWYNNRK